MSGLEFLEQLLNLSPLLQALLQLYALYSKNLSNCSDVNSNKAPNLTFDKVFYPAVYQTTFINLGSNSNLKKQKTPLLLVLNDAYTNDFWVELTVNNKTKTPKRVKVVNTAGGIYGELETDIDEIIPDTQIYDKATYSVVNNYSKKVVEISTPQTWYTLGVKIFTNELGQGFFINSMELKNIKQKLKTKGK